MTGMVVLYIFMLAAFTGYEVISRVPVILHTPLMSGSNFVHGIVLVGAMVALGNAHTPLEKTIGFIGVLLAAGAGSEHNTSGGNCAQERIQWSLRQRRQRISPPKGRQSRRKRSGLGDPPKDRCARRIDS